MKNTWLIWILIVGIFVGVLFIFNFQGNKSAVPLSEIFKDEKSQPANVEYEFVSKNEEDAKNAAAQKMNATAAATTAVTPPAAAKSQPAPASATAKTATTAPVKTQIASDAKKNPFTIQISSFQDKNKADKILGELTKKGYSPYIVSMNLSDKTFYRVYVGKYDSKAQAEESLAKIKQDYKDSFIIVLKK